MLLAFHTRETVDQRPGKWPGARKHFCVLQRGGRANAHKLLQRDTPRAHLAVAEHGASAPPASMMCYNARMGSCRSFIQPQAGPPPTSSHCCCVPLGSWAKCCQESRSLTRIQLYCPAVQPRSRPVGQGNGAQVRMQQGGAAMGPPCSSGDVVQEAVSGVPGLRPGPSCLATHARHSMRLAGLH
jgi:hypothetical protein